MTTVSGQRVVEAARKYVGVPYRHGGRHRKHGLDCGGLVVVTLQDLGLPVVDLGIGYSPVSTAYDLQSWVEGQGSVLPDPKERAPGDIVLFWWDRIHRRAGHLAFLSSKETIIHVYNHVNRVVEMPMERIWLRRIVSVVRIKGVV